MGVKLCTQRKSGLVTAPPEQTSITMPHYAGFWRRGAACWLDCLLINLVHTMLNFGLMVLTQLIFSLTPQPDWAWWVVQVVSLLLFVAVWLVYFGGFAVYAQGKTPGKQCFGLTICGANSQEQTLTWPQALLREGGKLLNMTVLLGIGLKIQPFMPKRQALHDMWAQTVVTHTPDTGATTWVIWLVNGLFLLGVLGICVALVCLLTMMMRQGLLPT
jgi:uncharacterized RDD family membrane protein YckC